MFLSLYFIVHCLNCCMSVTLAMSNLQSKLSNKFNRFIHFFSINCMNLFILHNICVCIRFKYFKIENFSTIIAG